MKKILLTSGTSFSSELTGDDYQDIVKWPTLLSKKMDLRLINKSKPGASNLYIFDHLMENIMKYGSEIELVVPAWSYGLKTSVFRNIELNLINIDDQEWGDDELAPLSKLLDSKIKSSNLLAKSLEQTLRLMVYLQDTCDSKNIKCVHYPLLNIFKTDLEQSVHFKILEQIIDSDMFQKLQQFDNIIGWPCDSLLGGYTFNTAYSEHVIDSNNHHPNSQGQKIIADEIYDKYLKI